MSSTLSGLLGVAAGYVKIGRDRIEKNPDKRVQDALQLVFTKFAELQSARQVHIWLREQGIELPVKSRQGEAHGVVWRLPAYNIVHNILTNRDSPSAYRWPMLTSVNWANVRCGWRQKATLASSDLRIAPVPAIQCERRCPRQDDAELGELAVFRVDVN